MARTQLYNAFLGIICIGVIVAGLGSAFLYVSKKGPFKNSNKELLTEVFNNDDELSPERRKQFKQEKCDTNKAMFTLNVTTDLFPKEISWELRTNTSSIVDNRSGYKKTNQLNVYKNCLASSGCFNFSVRDSAGDGLTSPGKISISFLHDNITIPSFGFKSSFSYQFGACYKKPSHLPSINPSVVPTKDSKLTSSNHISTTITSNHSTTIEPSFTPTDYSKTVEPSFTPTHHPSTFWSDSPSLKSEFDIQIVNLGNETYYDSAFENARQKWQTIIVGDKAFGGIFRKDYLFSTIENDDSYIIIDDVIIGYDFFENIHRNFSKSDDTAVVLGFGGPTFLRNDLPIAGIMLFSRQELLKMKMADAELIIMHEMAHVLGFGTLPNEICSQNCPNYACPVAQREYDNLNLDSFLLLESEICGHWAESSFQTSTSSELMTPYFEKDKYQPLTRVTAGALQDLGYEVNFYAADVFENHKSRSLAKTQHMTPTETFNLENYIIHRPKVTLIP